VFYTYFISYFVLHNDCSEGRKHVAGNYVIIIIIIITMANLLQVHFVGFIASTVIVRDTICALVKQQYVLCVFVEVNFIVNNTTILSLTKKCVAANNERPVGLHVKCPMFCSHLGKFSVSRQIFKKFPVSNFTEILPFGAALIHAN